MPELPDDQSLILNAAKACYLRIGVVKTTAADIAKEAGISRATLYRRFPSHEDIFIAVLARDSWDMVKDSENHLQGIVDPAERIIEGMLFCLDEMPRRPLHSHLLHENSQWVTQAMPAAKLHEIALSMLGEVMGINALDGQLRERVYDLAEWVLRALISYATVPSQRARNRDQMRQLLHAMLAPAINSVLVASATAPTGQSDKKAAASGAKVSSIRKVRSPKNITE